MIINAAISILLGERSTIEIYDRDAGIMFCSIELDPQQLTRCLGRLAMVHCDADVRGAHKIGLREERRWHEFPMPEASWKTRKAVAFEQAKITAPDGWEPDAGFSSQRSFFHRDGAEWARTTVRRWVPKEMEP